MVIGWAPWGCAVSWHSWWLGCRAGYLLPARLRSVAGWWPNEVWLKQLPQLLPTQVGGQSSVDKLGGEWVPKVGWGQELKEGVQQVEAGWLFPLQLPPHSALVWVEELTHLPEQCCSGLRWVQGPGMVQGTELQAAVLSPGTTLPAHLVQGCPCPHQSPAPDMRHSSFSAVCPGGGLSHTQHSSLPASCILWAGSLPSIYWFCLVAPCEPGSPSSLLLLGAPTQSPRHLGSVTKCRFN